MRVARGFGSGNTMVSVAELSLRYSDCSKSRPKLPQEFRTPIGETYSRIELQCFRRRSKWIAQFRPKTSNPNLTRNRNKMGIDVIFVEDREISYPLSLRPAYDLPRVNQCRDDMDPQSHWEN